MYQSIHHYKDFGPLILQPRIAKYTVWSFIFGRGRAISVGSWSTLSGPDWLRQSPCQPTCRCNTGTKNDKTKPETTAMAILVSRAPFMGSLLGRRSGEILSSGPIGTRACRRYFIQPSMLYGLLIGELKGAELDLISDTCNNTSGCVDYPDVPIFCVQRESAWPED